MRSGNFDIMGMLSFSLYTREGANKIVTMDCVVTGGFYSISSVTRGILQSMSE